jgi:hypothetical protein
MGMVFTSSDMWKATDKSKVVSQLDELKILLLAIVTDSAPAYNAAR